MMQRAVRLPSGHEQATRSQPGSVPGLGRSKPAGQSLVRSRIRATKSWTSLIPSPLDSCVCLCCPVVRYEVRYVHLVGVDPLLPVCELADFEACPSTKHGQGQYHDAYVHGCPPSSALGASPIPRPYARASPRRSGCPRRWLRQQGHGHSRGHQLWNLFGDRLTNGGLDRLLDRLDLPLPLRLSDSYCSGGIHSNSFDFGGNGRTGMSYRAAVRSMMLSHLPVV